MFLGGLRPLFNKATLRSAAIEYGRPACIVDMLET
jgi:hypothetical protein